MNITGLTLITSKNVYTIKKWAYDRRCIISLFKISSRFWIAEFVYSCVNIWFLLPRPVSIYIPEVFKTIEQKRIFADQQIQKYLNIRCQQQIELDEQHWLISVKV